MEKKIRFALMVFLTFVLVAPVAAASNRPFAVLSG